MEVERIVSKRIGKIQISKYVIKEEEEEMEVCVIGGKILVGSSIYVGKNVEKIREELSQGKLSPKSYDELKTKIYRPGGP